MYWCCYRMTIFLLVFKYFLWNDSQHHGHINFILNHFIFQIKYIHNSCGNKCMMNPCKSPGADLNLSGRRDFTAFLHPAPFPSTAEPGNEIDTRVKPAVGLTLDRRFLRWPNAMANKWESDMQWLTTREQKSWDKRYRKVQLMSSALLLF